MIMIAKLGALLSIIYLVKVFLYPVIRPINKKQKKRARRYMKERKNAAFHRKWTQWKVNFARNYVKYYLSSAERLRFQKMIDRLDLSVTPEEVRLNQLFYTMVTILVTLFMFSANRLLGCVSGILIIIGWLYPVTTMEEKIEKRNKGIALDFPSFYSMVYYQYAKSVNIYFADVIKDYLPNANADMSEELGVMLDNIEYGEEHALKQFKKRVPLHYIIRFCDIMETRLKGYDNVSQMAYLKNEVDQFRINALEDDLKRRERSNARVQFVLIAVLVVYIAIYYLFTIMESLKMFQ